MELQEYFSQNYQGCESFVKNVIYPIFGEEHFENGYNVSILEDDDNLREMANRFNIEEILRIGTIDIPFNPIELFDITIKDATQIAQNRAGIQAIIRRIMDTHSGAFMIFHYENTENWDWRFTFCEKGGSDQEFTSSKRYTYLLGRNHSCRTAAERFGELKKKNYVIELKDIINAFSVEILTKQFYRELFGWYQWALSKEIGVTYPNDINTEFDDGKIEEHLIRLITRLMFVWFIKQKQLVPDNLFEIGELQKLLKEFDPQSLTQGNYYNGILQNLFFATLNNEMNSRAFVVDNSFKGTVKDYGIKTLFRNPENDSWFKISNEKVLELFNQIPFLNGGLFECLDRDTPDSNGKIVYSDGFSRKAGKQKRAFLPNILFFEPQKGLISILSRYNFTVEENSPKEIQVALDPELLGKVFENLLGAYNPETQETARNQSGSFYTPREVVNYMVDEALVAYLGDNEYVRQLFKEESSLGLQSNSIEYKQIADKLKQVKILDPACGSGAFPMGILNRILELLSRLDYENKESRYEQKLHLIENCIYGVDIQTIAVQISKLRFFISLICEQEKEVDKPNFGIPILPNLETKFVAADSLIGLKKRAAQLNMFDRHEEIDVVKKKLLEVRHEHFSAKNATQKKKCRERDHQLCEELAILLADNQERSVEDARQLAEWDPYNQNLSSRFFDSEWMFGVKDSFDIIIGNPPYVQLQNNQGELAKKYAECGYKTFDRTGDIYCLFYERGWQLLKSEAYLCFITSNKWMRTGYGENTRKFLSEYTNPKQLIDFAGVRIFESATVDTNILLFSKSKNIEQTQACVAKNIDCRNNLSEYIHQNLSVCHFPVSESWTVLSPIEQQIKEKIERMGTPLKDWDIKIYRGVLTGCNEAFIIDGKKRNELIKQDPKSAEIIRPILRGRDIKRYGYEFADLYLIATFPSMHYDIDNYPSIKEHLLSFGIERLEQTGEEYSINGKRVKARKKTNNKWFETQDSISYWDDFSKQKIMYPNMTKYLPFYLDNEGFVQNDKAFMITGENLAFLVAFLNSSIFKFCFRNDFPELLGGTRELRKIFFDKISVIKVDSSYNQIFENNVSEIQKLKKAHQSIRNLAIEIDELIFKLYRLTPEEQQIVGYIEIE